MHFSPHYPLSNHHYELETSILQILLSDSPRTFMVLLKLIIPSKIISQFTFNSTSQTIISTQQHRTAVFSQQPKDYWALNVTKFISTTSQNTKDMLISYKKNIPCHIHTMNTKIANLHYAGFCGYFTHVIFMYLLYPIMERFKIAWFWI